MARNDWVALVTEASAEYLAQSELMRFGLGPYLPQALRQRVIEGQVRFRKYPLFSRYIFLPFCDLNRVIIRQCRGFCKVRPVLTDSDGETLWRAPDRVIQRLRDAEEAGQFNDNFRIGEKVQITHKNLSGIEAFIENSGDKSLTLFTPLLGGARVTVGRGQVVKAENS